MLVSRLKNKGGFTIIEATAGIVIFLVAMVGVTIVFTSGGAIIRQSTHASNAGNLASEKLAEAVRLPFFLEYDGADRDRDDFFYHEGVSNPNQLSSPGYTAAYGSITDYPNCRMEVAVQYQQVAAGGQLASAPDMKVGWGPKTPGNDEPFNVTNERLRLILIRVKVFYKTDAGEGSLTVEDMVNDSKIEYDPRIDSVHPNGFEVGSPFSFVVYGGGFSDDAGDPSVKPTVRIWKTGVFAYSDVSATVNGTDSNSTTLYCTAQINQARVSPDDVYWNITVVNTDSRANSLMGCFYQIENPPFITRLNPDNGSVGTWVEITGYDFGTKGAGDYVAFNGTQAINYNNPSVPGNPNWNNNRIWAQVPAGTTTGDVIVHTSAGDSNGSLFTIAGSVFISYINNVEDAKSGASGDIYDTVRVYGSGFGAIRGGGDVVRFYNGVNAVVYSVWSAVMIECVVPAGAVTGNVVVIDGGVSSNGRNFVIPYEAGH